MVEEIVEIPEGKVVVSDNGGVDINAGKIAATGQHSAADVAAAFFQLNAPKFEKLLSEMAPYKIRRAVLNAVTYPFIDRGYDPDTDEEKAFAYLVHEMMLNKTIMQLSFEMDKAEQDMLANQAKLEDNALTVDEEEMLKRIKNQE